MDIVLYDRDDSFSLMRRDGGYQVLPVEKFGLKPFATAMTRQLELWTKAAMDRQNSFSI
jgi:hypothetical protein